jgi:hypothetical protein
MCGKAKGNEDSPIIKNETSSNFDLDLWVRGACSIIRLVSMPNFKETGKNAKVWYFTKNHLEAHYLLLALSTLSG